MNIKILGYNEHDVEDVAKVLINFATERGLLVAASKSKFVPVLNQYSKKVRIQEEKDD